MANLFGQYHPKTFGANAPQNIYPAPPKTGAGSTGSRFNATGAGVGGGGAPADAQPTWGTQSGPTAIEDRYNQRATGSDPGWEYATGRATDAINKQYAARGGYNSSGAMNSIGDMFANATSQREGQLDTLANEATGAHQKSLDSMFGHGLGLAGGEAGVAGAYDQSAGGAMNAGNRAKIDLMLSKAGVDQKTRQGELDAIFGAAKTVAPFLG
jgi:hypothetical protein